MFTDFNKKLSYRKQIVHQQHTHIKNRKFSIKSFYGGGSIWDTDDGCHCRKHKIQCGIVFNWWGIVFHGEETLVTSMVAALLHSRFGHCRHKFHGRGIVFNGGYFFTGGNICETLGCNHYATKTVALQPTWQENCKIYTLHLYSTAP